MLRSKILELKSKLQSEVQDAFIVRNFFVTNFSLTQRIVQIMNQMYQNQMLSEMHVLCHELLKMQERVNLEIVTRQYVLTMDRKLLKDKLSISDVDIDGKIDQSQFIYFYIILL